MADVVMRAGLPVESYVKTKIISRPTNHQWSLLIIKELWSRRVEGLGCFRKVLLFTTIINHQNKATMVLFESLKCLKVCFTQIFPSGVAIMLETTMGHKTRYSS